jgi:dipeptidyl aminopeptidase/acylaminoacyl peptidase
MDPTPLPYGTWPSPVTPEQLGLQDRLAAPMFGGDGALWWVEVRPREGGRGVLVRAEPGGEPVDVLGAPWNVRTRVHEYGGRAFLVAGDLVVFSHDDDGCLYLSRHGGTPERLTAPGHRFAEPILDAERDRLIVTAERHVSGARHPENFIAAVSLADGAVTPLVTRRTFVAAPALSPDGKRLAWLAWDHPHMPWDAAELWLGLLDDDGRPVAHVPLGGGAGCAAFQPLFTPDGVLWCSIEDGDAAALHRLTRAAMVPSGRVDGELGAPLWQLGQRVIGAVDDGLVGIVTREGRSALVRLGDGPAVVLDDTLGTLGDLATHGSRVALAVGWAGSATQIVVRDLRDGSTRVVADVQRDWLDEADRSEPEGVTFPTGEGEVAHGFFYAPRRAGVCGPLDPSGSPTLPPLVVMAHGGPTGATAITPSARVQFFTTRGFAVLDVNYRGSTGYGRAYRERLRGGWGVLDVEDCVAGARWAADTGRVDGNRMVIRGGSAGGYTVLQALANHDVFRAGACYYGISDLEALLADTHKFESHYDRALVGRYPEERERFVARSPVHYPERIRVPVVFFQGLEDKAVPPAQTERMAEILRARGDRRAVPRLRRGAARVPEGRDAAARPRDGARVLPAGARARLILRSGLAATRLRRCRTDRRRASPTTRTAADRRGGTAGPRTARAPDAGGRAPRARPGGRAPRPAAPSAAGGAGARSPGACSTAGSRCPASGPPPRAAPRPASVGARRARGPGGPARSPRRHSPPADSRCCRPRSRPRRTRCRSR